MWRVKRSVRRRELEITLHCHTSIFHTSCTLPPSCITRRHEGVLGSLPDFGGYIRDYPVVDLLSSFL